MIRGSSSLPYEAVRALIDHPYDCPHTKTEIRQKKTDSLGRPHYYRQCLRCGLAVGNRLSGKNIDTSKAVPRWDDEREQKTWIKFRSDMTTAKGQIDLSAKDDWWARYDSYISSPEWARIRNSVLERDQFFCQGCGHHGANEVHHLTYEHMGQEFLFELVSVCSNCHDRLHPGRR